jgi:transposase
VATRHLAKHATSVETELDNRERYKARSEIECTFRMLEQARRFATRYEKTLRKYAAVVAIGCGLLWLRI